MRPARTAPYRGRTMATASLTNANALGVTYNPVAADANTNVILTLTIMGNGCCGNVVDTRILTITKSPTVLRVRMWRRAGDITYTVNDATFTNGTILWTHNGAGTLSNATSLSATYTPVASDAGNIVTPTLTVTGNGSCAAVADTKDPGPSRMVTVFAGADSETCDNASYTVTDATATNASVIAWTHNGAGTLTNANALSVTYNPVAADAGTNVILTLTITGNGSRAMLWIRGY